MCNRMTQAKIDMINLVMMKLFKQELHDVLFKPAYNTAPTELVPVVIEQDGVYQAELMQWGVVPRPGAAMVTNARDESLLNPDKPMFKEPAQKRRCGIFSDGFYEWAKFGSQRIPHYFFLRNHEPYVFAGIYEPPAVPNGPRRCLVVTTEPNELVAKYHNRMPVILQPEVHRAWLSTQQLTKENLSIYCRPYPAAEMEEYRTDTKMSNSRYKAPDAIAPWQPPSDELDFSS